MTSTNPEPTTNTHPSNPEAMASATPKPTITLRTAISADVRKILAFIHALAAYEKESPSIVEATVESLTATIFPPAPTPPYARVILAFVEGEAAGMALYFYNYSTWRAAPGLYLEDLFVYEQFRGMGIGTALLAALARECEKIGGKRVEWSVLKWNEPSIRFYESIGAVNMGVEWQVMRVTNEALEKLKGRGPEVIWADGVFL